MAMELFKDEWFWPGVVKQNHFMVDPALAPAAQLEKLHEDLWLSEDMLWVEFPNGVALDVGWYGGMLSPDGHFGIALNQSEEEYRPFYERLCSSFEELPAALEECLQIARRHPSVARHVFGQGEISPGWIEFDELILDHVAPLAAQTERLKSHLFEVSWSNGSILTIGWEPAHDPAGEFVITLKQDRRGRLGRVFAESEGPSREVPELRLVAQDHAQSIHDLKRIVAELVKEVERQSDPSDQKR